ncbi:hypothetical protein PPL_06301 [Heterostelium album PN500]|uniref:Uncharacterized protein n=1 Tax=Heterostelium pallidum (strain ATCC 26659 / Pp 5 / PN500) TaxID=670386 RepID=D3BCS3_HETP5|nr:hypothetical protein PPL_06301 [Heterostelium album PN500]EFA80715.1 hypothetical protein PPL_06301 [Heterostelium album PN500]|eukprot:XP_020432835.1 hypothetical protein PPL_06301 [Heterostelium album PN500]
MLIIKSSIMTNINNSLNSLSNEGIISISAKNSTSTTVPKSEQNFSKPFWNVC